MANNTFKLLSSALIIYSLSSITAPMPVQAEQSTFENYEKALVAFQQGEIDESNIYLKNILQKHPEHMPSRVLLAQIYIEKGDGIAAELELNKAKTASVDMNRLVNLFAKAYLLQNKYERALEVAKEGNRGARLESELAVYRGQAYIGNNLNKLADDAFSEALILIPNNQMALLGKAQMAFAAQHPQRAIKYIDKALNQATPFVNGWIMKANILQKLGDFDGALLALERALSIEPEHLAAHLSMSALYIHKKEFSKAEIYVDKIIAEIPNEPRAGYLKALINANKPTNADSPNKLTEVIATLSAVPDEVMRTTPDYYYLAGLTNFQSGNDEDARRYLSKYLTINEFHIDASRMVAIIDLRNNDFNSAKQLLTRVNIAKPNSANIITLLGMTYLALDEPKKAKLFFEQVLELYPTSEVGITNLARSKLQSGQYQSAIDALLAIKNNEVNGLQVKMLLLDSYEKSKEYQGALKIVESLTRLYPEDSYFQMRLATILGRSGDIEKSKLAYQKSIELDPNNVLAVAHLARLDFLEKKFDKAFALLDKKLKELPNNALILAEKSDGYFLQGKISEGTKLIEKAYALNRNDFLILRRLVVALSNNNRLDEAIDHTDAYIGQNSKDVNALKLISSLYEKKNNFKQAIMAMRDFVSKSNNKSSALVQLAKVQERALDTKGAIQSYKKATVLDNESLQAYLGLFNLVIKEKNESFALSIINSVFDINQDESLKNVLLGDLYLNLRDGSKARTYYSKALTISEQRQAILGLYNAYRLDDMYVQAVPKLKAWLSKYPKDLLVAISLADSYKGMKDYQASASLYETLMQDFGQLPILLNNAANVYFLNGDRVKAKEYAQQAYQYLGDNLAILDTLGWIESRMGNYEKALALFRKALTIDYVNVEVKYHLAATLVKLNRASEAKQYLFDVVESKKYFSEREAAEQLLSTLK